MFPDLAASKVIAAHLSRRAVLHVRQSSLRQILRNTESASTTCAARRTLIRKFFSWPLAREWNSSGRPDQAGA